jgi:hypothetical protein
MPIPMLAGRRRIIGLCALLAAANPAAWAGPGQLRRPPGAAGDGIARLHLRVAPRGRYRLTVTLTSVVVAVAIGGVELVGLYSDSGSGGMCRLVEILNDNFAAIGPR